jgi:hypothetical protein
MMQVPDPQHRGSVIISCTKQLQQAHEDIDKVQVQTQSTQDLGLAVWFIY